MASRKTPDGASLRLRDLEMTIGLIAAIRAQDKGARERVAAEFGIGKSVLSEAAKRVEDYFGVKLFDGPQSRSLTAAGKEAATWGPRLLLEIGEFREILQTAPEDEIAKNA